jgi:hypothetical protein
MRFVDYFRHQNFRLLLERLFFSCMLDLWLFVVRGQLLDTVDTVLKVLQEFVVEAGQFKELD